MFFLLVVLQISFFTDVRTLYIDSVLDLTRLCRQLFRVFARTRRRSTQQDCDTSRSLCTPSVYSSSAVMAWRMSCVILRVCRWSLPWHKLIQEHILAAKHMFGSSSYCRAVVYGTKVGKDNQYAFQYECTTRRKSAANRLDSVINAQSPIRTASRCGFHARSWRHPQLTCRVVQSAAKSAHYTSQSPGLILAATVSMHHPSAKSPTLSPSSP